MFFSLLCRYHLRDIVVGKIFFLLVRLKIKHMELELRRREITALGTASLSACALCSFF